MALAAGKYQGRIGSRDYSMVGTWPSDSARWISDYRPIITQGVGCPCQEGNALSGYSYTAEQVSGWSLGVLIGGFVTVGALVLLSRRR